MAPQLRTQRDRRPLPIHHVVLPSVRIPPTKAKSHLPHPVLVFFRLHFGNQYILYASIHQRLINRQVRKDRSLKAQIPHTDSIQHRQIRPHPHPVQLRQQPRPVHGMPPDVERPVQDDTQADIHRGKMLPTMAQQIQRVETCGRQGNVRYSRWLHLVKLPLQDSLISAVERCACTLRKL